MTYASFCSYPKNNKPISDWAYSFAKRIVLFFKVAFSRNIHFLRGLNLEELNLSTGVYFVEFLTNEIQSELHKFKKLVYINK
jgi:hypothetical protein